MCVATACCSYLRTHWQVAGCIITARGNEIRPAALSSLWCAFAATQDISMSCVNKGAMLLAFYYIECVYENPFVHANYNERGVGAESGERYIYRRCQISKASSEWVLRPASPHTNEHWLLWCAFGIHSNAYMRESPTGLIYEKGMLCYMWEIWYYALGRVSCCGRRRSVVKFAHADLWIWCCARCVGGLHETRQSNGTDKFSKTCRIAGCQD